MKTFHLFKKRLLTLFRKLQKCLNAQLYEAQIWITFRYQRVLSFEAYCSELDYAYISLQRVFHPVKETRTLWKFLYYGKQELTTWVVKSWEKHGVYILRKLNLMFIQKVMEVRKKKNDIRFPMFLNQIKVYELGASIKVSNTAMYKLVWEYCDPKGSVWGYIEHSVSIIKHQLKSRLK